MIPKHDVHDETVRSEILDNGHVILVARDKGHLVVLRLHDASVSVFRHAMCDRDVDFLLLPGGVPVVRRHLKAVPFYYLPERLSGWRRPPEVCCADVLGTSTAELMERAVVDLPCVIYDTAIHRVDDGGRPGKLLRDG